MKLLSLIFVLMSFNALSAQNPIVVMDTSKGKIEIELYKKKAPISVENFLSYVDKKFYDGTIFHRVIDNFMIQGGGFKKDLARKSTAAAIKNEADNGLSNEVGTIAMARTSEVNSATSQFFINVNDNKFLDHRAKTPRAYGYAVFGKVISGMSVINRIKKMATMANGPFQNLPRETVVIKSVKRKK